MTSISNVGSSSLLSNYLDSTSTKNLDEKTIFKKLSIDVGSDGKEITKDQLDSYIAKAKAGKSGKEDTSGISDEELKGLTTLQKDWNKIALGGDNISYANISAAGYKSTLTSMDKPDEKSSVDISALKKANAQSQQDINSYLVESALGTSTNQSSSAKSLLQTLLTGNTDEKDDSNAELIGKLVNIIESYKSASTIEEEA